MQTPKHKKTSVAFAISSLLLIGSTSAQAQEYINSQVGQDWVNSHLIITTAGALADATGNVVIDDNVSITGNLDMTDGQISNLTSASSIITVTVQGNSDGSNNPEEGVILSSNGAGTLSASQSSISVLTSGVVTVLGHDYQH